LLIIKIISFFSLNYKEGKEREGKGGIYFVNQAQIFLQKFVLEIIFINKIKLLIKNNKKKVNTPKNTPIINPKGKIIPIPKLIPEQTP